MDYKLSDATIHVKATQKGDDEYTDCIEFFTAGSFYHKNGSHYIRYTEQGDGMEKVNTTVKVEGDKRVTVMRHGAQRYEIVLTKGERQHGFYNTGYGDLMLGISGTKIHSELSEKGGSLRLEYMLDINNVLVSKNTLEINVKEIKTES